MTVPLHYIQHKATEILYVLETTAGLYIHKLTGYDNWEASFLLTLDQLKIGLYWLALSGAVHKFPQLSFLWIKQIKMVHFVVPPVCCSLICTG